MTKCYSNKILLLIIILSAVLRLATLDFNDLWHDEYLSIFASRMEVKDLIKTLQIYTAPPLFYILLKAWFALTDGLFHPRMFTVLWAIAGVYLTYLLGRRLMGREVGLIAALLLAIAPYHIRYSQELRMYIMQTTLLTAETLALLSALRKGKPARWLLYGFLIALNLALKYQSVFYCFVEWVFIFVYAVVSRNRNLLRGLLIATLLGEIVMSPIIWLGARQLAMADLGLGWVLPTHPTDFLRCFLITLIYYMMAFKESWWMWALSSTVALIILL
ncbi:MAG: glycosyltransferase family 39 protein [Candidatus Sumerlaeia bacterium]|nr:glycosyltransferase family 39 protein [Candidatus Sumerlaeia bacterium]